jgi:Icc-related predicted phosphoesterase
MASFFFASDLHGQPHRYESLNTAIGRQCPDAVLLGGDLLPSTRADDFLENVLARGLSSLRRQLGDRYPSVFLILGNDDPRVHEPAVRRHEDDGLWTYLHGRSRTIGLHRLYGYSYVPPTPFLLKDWERYDVSHYVDPGSVSPEDGFRSVDVPASEARYATIQSDLERLVAEDDLRQAIFLFHTPPYQTRLDRAALDGKLVDHVPLDVHVGSVAVRRFIEARQPLVTLHGHVHESARITGAWMDRIGGTVMMGAAHDGPELALIRFDPDDPGRATRELL